MERPLTRNEQEVQELYLLIIDEDGTVGPMDAARYALSILPRKMRGWTYTDADDNRVSLAERRIDMEFVDMVSMGTLTLDPDGRVVESLVEVDWKQPYQKLRLVQDTREPE